MGWWVHTALKIIAGERNAPASSPSLRSTFTPPQKQPPKPRTQGLHTTCPNTYSARLSIPLDIPLKI